MNRRRFVQSGLAAAVVASLPAKQSIAALLNLTTEVRRFGLIGVNGKVIVEERVTDTLANQLAFKQAFIQLGGPNQNPDHKVFQPQSQISVNIDVGILGDTLASGGSARLSDFDVLFSQIDLTPPQVIGGELIPIESTSLILAGAQSFSWMIPVILSVVGIGLFVVSRKSE